jgi:hypothetical protein
MHLAQAAKVEVRMPHREQPPWSNPRTSRWEHLNDKGFLPKASDGSAEPSMQISGSPRTQMIFGADTRVHHMNYGSCGKLFNANTGEVAEWLNAAVC